MWIRGWPMDFRYKGLVMQTAFPYHDVVVQWSNIQSSAVLTRPNMIRYLTNICRNSDRISEAGPIIDIPYLARRASYGLSFVKICEKIDRVITAPHYITNKVEYEGLCCIWQPGVETQQEKRSTVKSSEASHSCYCTIRLHDFLAVAPLKTKRHCDTMRSWYIAAIYISWYIAAIYISSYNSRKKRNPIARSWPKL